MLFTKLPELRHLIVKLLARLIEIHFEFIIPIISSSIPKECWKTLLDDLPEIAKEAGTIAANNLKTKEKET